MLEDQLRARGFRLNRFTSVAHIAEAVPNGRIAKYNEAATRYAIETNADIWCSASGADTASTASAWTCSTYRSCRCRATGTPRAARRCRATTSAISAAWGVQPNPAAVSNE